MMMPKNTVIKQETLKLSVRDGKVTAAVLFARFLTPPEALTRLDDFIPLGLRSPRLAKVTLPASWTNAKHGFGASVTPVPGGQVVEFHLGASPSSSRSPIAPPPSHPVIQSPTHPVTSSSGCGSGAGCGSSGCGMATASSRSPVSPSARPTSALASTAPHRAMSQSCGCGAGGCGSSGAGCGSSGCSMATASSRSPVSPSLPHLVTQSPTHPVIPSPPHSVSPLPPTPPLAYTAQLPTAPFAHRFGRVFLQAVPARIIAGRANDVKLIAYVKADGGTPLGWGFRLPDEVDGAKIEIVQAPEGAVKRTMANATIVSGRMDKPQTRIELSVRITPQHASQLDFGSVFQCAVMPSSAPVVAAPKAWSDGGTLKTAVRGVVVFESRLKLMVRTKAAARK